MSYVYLEFCSFSRNISFLVPLFSGYPCIILWRFFCGHEDHDLTSSRLPYVLLQITNGQDDSEVSIDDLPTKLTGLTEVSCAKHLHVPS